MLGHILVIDQGTTSTRSIVYDNEMNVLAVAQQEIQQVFPDDGHVEHIPTELLETSVSTAEEALAKAAVAGVEIAGIGITNQRETTIVWDRATGKPIHNAIVWQDRRTFRMCERLKSEGHEALITQKTGLVLDPYFSATKVAWILDNVTDARDRARNGELLFGTVDSWLIWNLTGGKCHVTDATNAARTMLFDINEKCWSKEICQLLNIPMAMLPKVFDCAADFGTTESHFLGAKIPIFGVAGDQQAATIGQACFEPGMLKATYGTGCFALLNTGGNPVRSKNKLLTTIAYQLDGKTTYALEGSIFIAGAVVQWLRDGLGFIREAGQSQGLAEKADATQSVILVPAFTGLGAPYWQPECRGAIFGLTRNSGPSEITLAALQSVGYQTADLMNAMRADWTDASQSILRVDGGMAASDMTMQFLADINQTQVDRPANLETTALGAAWLAGQRAGIYPEQSEFARTWRCETKFLPQMAAEESANKYKAWKRAVAAAMSV